ncbi:sigma-70 family RNA polymerase sigma factor [Haloferula sp. A504]|uniref:sigma-70 family RNA polymerase sigma factor n=1 Tax=Haloferula sp. A504 TaxID=3373601 RepID=UPI0031BD77D0|nr:sigma-70 family RNA polymerase sigma factor [Verrucomicrobiaceae bacterium E54]
MAAAEQDNIHPFPEEKSFNQLLTGEQEFLRALLRTIGVPASDVADVLQDANVYLIANQAKYLPGTNFRAWAGQVARFRSLNYFRSKKRRPMVNLSEQALDMIVEEVVLRFDENHARLQKLGHCLSKLSDDQRQLLDAVYAKGTSLKDLARAKRCSHAAMRKTVSRIRQTLKACIEYQTES